MINGQKYKELIEELGLNVFSMENAIGVKRSRLSKAIERNSEIKLDIVEMTVAKFPRVNKDWLMTGKGEMFLPSITSEPAVSYNTKNHGQEINKLLRDMALTTIELTGPADALQRLRDQIKSLGKIADELEGE